MLFSLSKWYVAPTGGCSLTPLHEKKVLALVQESERNKTRKFKVKGSVEVSCGENLWELGKVYKVFACHINAF